MTINNKYSKSIRHILKGYVLPKALMGIDLNKYQNSQNVQQIPGVIGSIIGMADQIAKPMKERADATNSSGALVNEQKSANTAQAGLVFDPLRTSIKTFTDNDATRKEKWGAVGGILGLPGLASTFGKARAKRLNQQGIEDTRNAYSQVATNNYSNLINQQLRFAFGGNIGKGSNIVDYKGATHGEGGIEVDSTGTPTVMSGKKGIAETETDELSFNGYVFSNKLRYNGK
jgi:hypothetical protein